MTAKTTAFHVLWSFLVKLAGSAASPMTKNAGNLMGDGSAWTTGGRDLPPSGKLCLQPP